MSVWTQGGKDIGSSLTGSLHKAVLCVPRVDFTRNDKGMIVAEEITNRKYCTLKVQFNPNQLHFTSTADSCHAGGIGDSGSNDTAQIIGPSITTMDVTLVFDAMNVKDAFMWEKYRLSANDLVMDITAAANRKSYRVDHIVNALLALSIHGATRHVIFQWSDLTFSGELTGIKATYTMFNPSGRPIRAEIAITITERLEKDEKHRESYWEGAFNKIFGSGSENTTLNGKSILDNTKSLFHLNI